MNQTTQLLEAVKQCMKARGITYRELGRSLKLSEASIKRLFSNKSFSLARLEEICNVLGLTFAELVKLSDNKNSTYEEAQLLTIEQEEVLASDEKLLAFFYLLINDWSPKEIIKSYEFSEKEIERLLLRLDKLNLIELHVKNRIKVRKEFNWRPNGMLIKQYEQRVRKEFFASNFLAKRECFKFAAGEMSGTTVRILLHKIADLMKSFNSYAEIDSALPKVETESIGIVIALRPWVFSAFSHLKRNRH